MPAPAAAKVLSVLPVAVVVVVVPLLIPLPLPLPLPPEAERRFVEERVFSFVLSLSLSFSFPFSFSRDGVLVSCSAELELELEPVLALLERPVGVAGAGFCLERELEEERSGLGVSAGGWVVCCGDVLGAAGGEGARLARSSAACFSARRSKKDLDSARVTASGDGWVEAGGAGVAVGAGSAGLATGSAVGSGCAAAVTVGFVSLASVWAEAGDGLVSGCVCRAGLLISSVATCSPLATNPNASASSFSSAGLF